ncbi:uncharacterized protein LOC142775436 [Rhipicephalus microplus]|uniref:uncharacterized protein LOC142775436 n=1 Tax=Rhipicephalus microplus TaxID=6941 RepID=UPI003F6D90D9
MDCTEMPRCCALAARTALPVRTSFFFVPRGKENLKRRAIWLHHIGRKNFNCREGKPCERLVFYGLASVFVFLLRAPPTVLQWPLYALKALWKDHYDQQELKKQD